MDKRKIVIIGGGFGGLAVAKTLKGSELEITLIDKTNHHLFQPLLYQVATAALSPADIAIPIREILYKQKNVKVIMGEVVSIDKENKQVLLKDGEYKYDYLIIATGSRHSYFGNDNWESIAPGLKTVADALNLREKILFSFEKAERLTDQKEIDKCLTFVIVGGGPTGVELAGAIAEIARKTLLKLFKNIDPAKTKVILVEGADKILSAYEEPLNEKAKVMLESLGVEVKLNSFVSKISDEGVQIGEEIIETENVIWAAGNQASPLLKTLNTELDNVGRVIVNNDCTIKESECIFVIGDAAKFLDENNNPLPGVAPVAAQQGRYVGKTIKLKIPKEKRETFKYFDKGSLATIGRSKAVMQMGKLKLSGFPAWFLWSFVHIALLINFRERFSVMMEWIWDYFTYRHVVRLIVYKKDV